MTEPWINRTAKSGEALTASAQMGGEWPASYDDTFIAIGKALTVPPGTHVGISVRAFYEALGLPHPRPPGSNETNPSPQQPTGSRPTGSTSAPHPVGTNR